MQNELLKKVYQHALDLQIEIALKERITATQCEDFRKQLSELNKSIDSYLSRLQDMGNYQHGNVDAENGFNGAASERHIQDSDGDALLDGDKTGNKD